MKKWKYKLISMRSSTSIEAHENVLNDWGSEGWEICGCSLNTIDHGVLGSTNSIVYTLKKEIK